MIVFTDSFTVGADVDIASYPGTPDYSYVMGSNLLVVAAQDRVTTTIEGQDNVARLLNAACPTGDQQITADCRYDPGLGADDRGFVTARCAAASADFYDGTIRPIDAGANETQIFRFDGGSPTLLADGDRGFSAAGTYSHRLKATGTNPVSLELQIDATAVVTYDDADAARKQSGRSGVAVYWHSGVDVWVDNVSVDDLVPEVVDMSWVTGDRVKETTTTTGTGPLTLAGAVSAFRAFSVACIDGDQIAYAILGGTEWEVGLGTWGTGNILNRTKVFASSNAGALVNFSAGTKEVWCDFPARYGLLPPTSRVLTEDVTLPMETSVYVADEFEVQAGNELDIGVNAVLEVG